MGTTPQAAGKCPRVKSIHWILFTYYKELIFRLNYLVQTKGFGVLTGGPGRGKTTMIRHWVKSLNQSAYKVIYIPMSTLTVMEFYRQLAEALGLEAYHRKSDNFKAIQKAIERYTVDLHNNLKEKFKII